MKRHHHQQKYIQFLFFYIWSHRDLFVSWIMTHKKKISPFEEWTRSWNVMSAYKSISLDNITWFPLKSSKLVPPKLPSTFWGNYWKGFCKLLCKNQCLPKKSFWNNRMDVVLWKRNVIFFFWLLLSNSRVEEHLLKNHVNM